MDDKQFAEDKYHWNTLSEQDSLEAYHQRQATHELRRKLYRDKLYQALQQGFFASLSKHEKRVFNLYYFKGINVYKIAKLLNKKWSTVDTLRRRAEKKLRSFI